MPARGGDLRGLVDTHGKGSEEPAVDRSRRRRQRPSGQERDGVEGREIARRMSRLLHRHLLVHGDDGTPSPLVRRGQIRDDAHHHRFVERVVEMDDERFIGELECPGVTENGLDRESTLARDAALATAVA